MKKRVNRQPVLIGLTGGPGVGKSEVANYLSQAGAMVINADKIGHEILLYNKAIKSKLIKLLSKEIIAADGSLDRKAIGARVFADPELMLGFNAIIHPALLKELKSRLMKASKSPKYNMIVVDAALIFEWGIASWFDLLLVVNAKRDVRLARMTKSGLSRNQAIKRIASQIPQRDKRALADYVIENNLTKNRLKKSVRSFIANVETWRIGEN